VKTEIKVFEIIVAVIVVIALIMLGRKMLAGRRILNTANNTFEQAQPVIAIGFLMTLFVCVIFSTTYFYPDFIAEPVSKNAHDVVPAFNVTFVATSIAFFLTQFGVFYFAFRYRSTRSNQAEHIKQNTKLEIAWTLTPTFVFMFLFLWGQILWAKITKAPSGDVLLIDVVGQQFSWLAHYAGRDHRLGQNDFRLIDNVNTVGIDFNDPASKDDFIPVQMHVPKGRPVLLLLRSKDVIHSFYIPYMGVKMDAVPGMITTLSFTPTKTTREMRKKLKDNDFDFEVACAELCGRMHFAMKLIVVVDEPAEFETWYNQQASWISTHNPDDILQ
jgi:cytochrome c oxidase subunit 2